MSEKETVIALSKKWAVEQKKFNNCTFDCALELFIPLLQDSLQIHPAALYMNLMG